MLHHIGITRVFNIDVIAVNIVHLTVGMCGRPIRIRAGYQHCVAEI